jgi:rhamnulokinase
MVCEYTVASTSQLLNPVTGDLDEALLASVGLKRSQFGPLVQPGECIGRLTPRLAEYTGLGPVPVVAVAGHDTASAVIAVPAEDDNFAYLSCGTWSLLGIESPSPIITAESAKANFTNEGGIDGTTRFLKNITGLWIYENCRREWGESVPQNVNDLNALCLESSFAGSSIPTTPLSPIPSR